jgi:putative membrane protein
LGDRASWGIILAAVLVDGLCRFFPAHLPFVLPFVFNAPVFLGTWFVLLWYFRGLKLVSAENKPGWLRQSFFVGGVLSIYFVLQTHFEYFSQHLFSLNRTQAVTIGMVAPFFIGIAWMAEVLEAGAPGWVVRACKSRFVARAGIVLFHPLPAMAIFLLTTDVWLIPSVHFAAMINPFLYAVMNISCLAGGLLFWLVVLDPRPKPQARFSYLFRAGCGFVVMFPQIAVSSYIALTTVDLYSFYTLCGRIFPAMSPAYDQMLGGMIQWIPPGMMNTAVLLLALNALRLSDAKADKAFVIPPGAKVYESKWTGNSRQ